MTYRRLFAVTVFLVVAAIPMQAQNSDIIANTLGVGPRAGLYASNDAEEGAWYFGVAGRARLGKNLGFELTLDYRAAERFTAAGVDERGYLAKVAYLPVTVSAMLFIPVGSTLAPYAVGGLGWYYTFIDYTIHWSRLPELREIFEDKNSFVPGYHIGAGCEVLLGKNLALYGEFRYLFLGTEIKSPRDLLSLDVNTHNSDGTVLSGGFILYL